MKSQRYKISSMEDIAFNTTYYLISIINEKYRSPLDFKINNIKRQFWDLLGIIK